MDRILAAMQQSEGPLDKCLLPVLIERDNWTRCEYERRSLLLVRTLTTFSEEEIDRLDATAKRRLLQLARYDTAGNRVPVRIADAVRRSYVGRFFGGRAVRGGLSADRRASR